MAANNDGNIIIGQVVFLYRSLAYRHAAAGDAAQGAHAAAGHWDRRGSAELRDGAARPCADRSLARGTHGQCRASDGGDTAGEAAREVLSDLRLFDARCNWSAAASNSCGVDTAPLADQRYVEPAQQGPRGASRTAPGRQAATRRLPVGSWCRSRAPGGGLTSGPPVSSQLRTSIPSSTRQLIASRPVRVESAPYLAELVKSSCNAR